MLKCPSLLEPGRSTASTASSCSPCPGSQQVPMADALAQLQLAGAGGC